MFCQKCGGEIPQGSAFCPSCGASVDTAPANNSFNNAPAASVEQTFTAQAANQPIDSPYANQPAGSPYIAPAGGSPYTNQPAGSPYAAQPAGSPYANQPAGSPYAAQPKAPCSPQYKPLGAWAYFGYTLLFNIPLVGLIILIVFSAGGTHNINLRNYARSFFCVLALWLILIGVFIAIALATGGIGYLNYLLSQLGIF